MSKTEKATREYLETLSKDQVVNLCLQFMFDAEISEQQLAEKDKEIERLNTIIGLSQLQVSEKDRLNTSVNINSLQYNQTQLAITELEKVKENLKQLEINIDNQAGFSQGYKLELKQKSLYKNVYKTIDQQIKELKGEN